MERNSKLSFRACQVCFTDARNERFASLSTFLALWHLEFLLPRRRADGWLDGKDYGWMDGKSGR
eukprot:scaffold246081_cov22-Prasinocladus_malaysianus.AAC.1